MRRDASCSYRLLLLGTAALLALFAVYSRIWEFMEIFPRVPLFLLWMTAPVALMALNTWIVGRYLCSGDSGWMFRTGTILFLASGALIYGRILFVPEGGQMDVNLVFLFGPFYHFFAVAAVTVGYLAKSIHRLLEERVGPGS